MTGAAYELDMESLLARVHALLDEWGACQRHEPGIGRLTYSGHSPGADMIDVAGRKERYLPAYSRPRRTVEMQPDADGKVQKLAVRDMIPRQAEKQTRVRKVVSSPRWPEHIEAMEQIVARLPRELVDAVSLYCIDELTIRECADVARVSKAKFQQRIDRARYMIAGQIVTDSRLTG